jgi:tetratricopeptide (TPR) repeat protein
MEQKKLSGKISKKVLLASLVACCVINIQTVNALEYSDKQPILMNPQKGAPIQLITEQEKLHAEGLRPKVPSKTIKTKIQKIKKKKYYYKKAKQKPIKVEKLLEYNRLNEAEKILRSKLEKNPKDIEARGLWLTLLAKQLSLDPAQTQLNKYLASNPKHAEFHYAQGIVYFKRTTSSNMVYITNKDKLLNDALHQFETAIELNTKDARYQNAAGVIKLNQGKIEEAKKYFEQAIKLDKTYSTALDNLGTIYYTKGNLEKAEQLYEKSLSYNTSNPTAMYHVAQVAYLQEDFAEAITQLNNALSINPNFYPALNLIGKIYEKQGNEAAAINAFKKSVMVKPEFPHPYLNLAQIYERRGDAEFAIEQLKTSLSVNPDFYPAKLKVADISLANAKYNQAIKNYKSLIGIKGFNEEALKGLANAYFGQAQIYSTKALTTGSNQDYFKALSNINRAIALGNDDLELHLAKLKLERITNQPKDSNETLELIINRSGEDLVLLVVKGEAYLAMNDYENAKQTYNKAAQATKTLEEDLYLAEIFIYHKQYENAKVVLLNILLNEPENQQAITDLEYIKLCQKQAELYLNSAKFYLKAKNNTLATNYLSRSLALDPSNAEAHLLLAKLYEKQKRYAGAIKNYRAYIALNKNPKNKKSIEKAEKKIKNLEKSLKILQLDY